MHCVTRHRHGATFRDIGIRRSWWERRVIIKRWERAGKDIQKGFRFLLVNTGASQVLLQSLVVAEGSIACLTVEGRAKRW